jgi:prepilin-type N-terminal cleavage/methylation domain-containing protein
MNTFRQKGFSIIEVVIVIVILGVIGFLGYTFYNNSHPKTTATTSQSATATDVAAAPSITSTSDLDKAQSVLDQTNPDNSPDSSQLDSELSNF